MMIFFSSESVTPPNKSRCTKSSHTKSELHVLHTVTTLTCHFLQKKMTESLCHSNHSLRLNQMLQWSTQPPSLWRQHLYACSVNLAPLTLIYFGLIVPLLIVPLYLNILYTVGKLFLHGRHPIYSVYSECHVHLFYSHRRAHTCCFIGSLDCGSVLILVCLDDLS